MKLNKIVLICLVLAMPLRAENSTCDVRLGLCNKLVNDYVKETHLLNQKVIILTQERDEAEQSLSKATEPRLLPTWSWFVMGAILGAGSYAIIRR